MANYVYIATSLDGYIADEDESIDWLTEFPNPDQSDYGFAEFSSRIDALIMGRKTYELVSSFEGEWPYQQPVFVLSNTLKRVPDERADKVKIVNGKLEDIVQQLKKSGMEHLYIDGGIAIQSFLKEDLIDELIIARIPILLGGGVPLFGDLTQELTFEHIETKIYENGIVKSHYSRKR